MSWIGWILLSAVFLALYDLAKKAGVRNNAVLPVLFISTVSGCAAYVLVLASCGHLGTVCATLNRDVLTLGLSKAVLVASSWIFTFCALRTLPITIATPIRASSPALVFFAALFIYREVPTLIQGLGMLLVFTGYFLFSRAGRHEGIDFLRNRAVWCAVVGALLAAASSLWDKYVFQVRQAPIEGTQLVYQFGLVLVYAIGLCFPRRNAFQWRWTIPLVGILLAVSDYLSFNGLSIKGTPISEAALMRRFSVVLTFVFGAIVFRETNLMRKALSLSLVVIGIVILALS